MLGSICGVTYLWLSKLWQVELVNFCSNDNVFIVRYVEQCHTVQHSCVEREWQL